MIKDVKIIQSRVSLNYFMQITAEMLMLWLSE